MVLHRPIETTALTRSLRVEGQSEGPLKKRRQLYRLANMRKYSKSNTLAAGARIGGTEEHTAGNGLGRRGAP
jgi:hypothetical protein